MSHPSSSLESSGKGRLQNFIFKFRFNSSFRKRHCHLTARERLLTRIVSLANTGGLSFLVGINSFENNRFIAFACSESNFGHHQKKPSRRNKEFWALSCVASIATATGCSSDRTRIRFPFDTPKIVCFT